MSEDNAGALRRAAISVGGDMDDTALTISEMSIKAPYYIYRLLSGAVAELVKPDVIEIRCEGNQYYVSQEMFERIDRVKKRVLEEDMKIGGYSYPYSVEGVVKIFTAAKRKSEIEFGIDPKLLRVLYLRQDNSGCGFYRVIQPVTFLKRIEGSCLYVEESEYLSFQLGTSMDVIVAPRVCHPTTAGMMRGLQNIGKLIVYEADDLLSNVPVWNPYRSIITAEMTEIREAVKNSANALIVSTPELNEELGRPDVTHVATNGIDGLRWPMKIREQTTDVVRILWAGSNTHEGDLAMVIKPLKNLLRRFGKKLQIVFVAYLPDGFKEYKKRPCPGVVEEVADAYKDQVVFVPGCNVFQWPQHLAAQNCHIAITPLVEHPFNRCKSELKVLEGWALGLPVVASSIAPYERVIVHDVNGLLCKDVDSWEVHLEGLICSAERRVKLATGGQQTLRDKYLMENVVTQSELALLRIAQNKVARPQCNDAINARLEAMENHAE